MGFIEIAAQGFGIIGLLLAAISFQEKNNKRFFVEQGLSGLSFFLNFLLIGAASAALFNLVNLLRGILFARNGWRGGKTILLEVLYTACFLYSLIPNLHDPFQIFLSAITFVGLTVMTIFMWRGNGKHIRILQFCYVSPAWLIHNVFNFSLGGILCEAFNMLSVIISFVRYGKDGFEASKG